jgi:hypothetical protein
VQLSTAWVPKHTNLSFYTDDDTKQNKNIHDVADAVRYWAGMNAEGAISTVLHRLQAVSAKMTNNPTLKLLMGKLLGGGQQALSSTDEFAQSLGGTEGMGLILGLAEETGKPLIFAGEGSVITVAPPGSGKKQCHVFPTLLSWKGPAVVLDVKGEIYAGTSKWRSENVGPVYKFSPLDPAASHGYNPLTAIRSDPDCLWGGFALSGRHDARADRGEGPVLGEPRPRRADGRDCASMSQPRRLQTVTGRRARRVSWRGLGPVRPRAANGRRYSFDDAGGLFAGRDGAQDARRRSANGTGEFERVGRRSHRARSI